MASSDALLRSFEAAGIRDQRLLDAVRLVPRHEFVPRGCVGRAYEDVPLPIPHEQVTTQPTLIAKMIEALALVGGERVLEVGTGYGFQTALLARLAREVWSVERWPDVAQTASTNLARNAVENATVIVADGTLGLPEHAPFDAIVVSAAHPAVPDPLVEQLANGGRLVQPIGPGGHENVALFVKDDGRVRRAALVTAANFVRLIGEHGFQH
jgi:protein-L-isoaspartate(D-aspartate) O-methyltransferase